MPLHTHYDNLKVSHSAPAEVIRAAYRVLAQRYHPDVNRSPEAEAIMKVINEAYAVLSDPRRRAEHDAWIKTQNGKESGDPDSSGARKQDGRRSAPQPGPTDPFDSAPPPPRPPTYSSSWETEKHLVEATLGVLVLICAAVFAWAWAKSPSRTNHPPGQTPSYNTPQAAEFKQISPDQAASHNTPHVTELKQTSPDQTASQDASFVADVARIPDRELLSLICDANNIKGSTCSEAKGYPPEMYGEGRACKVELQQTRAEGRFLSRDSKVLLVVYRSDCEPHVMNWGGALLFEKSGASLVFNGYQRGLRVSECASVPGGSGRDRLFCVDGGIAQGYAVSVLTEVIFTQAIDGEVRTSSDVLLRAIDSTGAWGAIRVECEASLALFDISSPKEGPAPNTVLVQARYADVDLIRKACAPNHVPPTNIVDGAPSDMVFINEDEVQEGQFIVDLATRKLAKVSLPQRIQQ